MGLTGEQEDGISKLPNASMMPRKRSLCRKGAARFALNLPLLPSLA